MAGGPSTPALVAGVGRAGALGFLAAGYKTPQAVVDEVAAVRAAGVPFGVNLFAPNPVPVDRSAFRRYAEALQADADRYGLDSAGAEPVEDDDHWQGKLDVLLADPVPVVSFAFGVPGADVVARLRRAGSLVVQTVTSAAEAGVAVEAGPDLLVVQSSAAGAHSGTLTPDRLPPEVPLTELLAAVRAVTTLPLLAAGGLGTAADVRDVLGAGAAAAVVGTVLLRADESGASELQKAALADPAAAARGTIVTRAFTGRPARALRNAFTDRYHALAPSGYPAVHHLTRPLRLAATAAGDADRVNLWAGTGHRHAGTGPVADLLARLV
jgi:NAD(P)H-dependent flavin oxidoreductase YrpB (nitropropane dioxygenase family)